MSSSSRDSKYLMTTPMSPGMAPARGYRGYAEARRGDTSNLVSTSPVGE